MYGMCLEVQSCVFFFQESSQLPVSFATLSTWNWLCKMLLFTFTNKIQPVMPRDVFLKYLSCAKSAQKLPAFLSSFLIFSHSFIHLSYSDFLTFLLSHLRLFSSFQCANSLFILFRPTSCVFADHLQPSLLMAPPSEIEIAPVYEIVLSHGTNQHY